MPENMSGTLTFAYEAPRRLRVAFLGTSGHAFRNFLPALPYAPVELVAVWDADADRAEAFARQFGAPRWYSDLERLLGELAPEGVLIGVDSPPGEETLNAMLMRRCLEAGCHVWTDKPLAAHADTVRALIQLRNAAKRVAAVGIKTMFYPAHLKVREIVQDASFGNPTSITVRYPLHIPEQAGLPTDNPTVHRCLVHLWHPFGTALVTLGRIRHLLTKPAPTGGGGVALATFDNGAVGTFHFSAGQAGTSPLERLEVIGEGANVVVENAVRLTYYRHGSPGPYGRTPSYLTDAAHAPLSWEPEMSLGQIYNTNNFVQGYAPSIIAFAHAAIGGPALPYGRLEDALEVVKLFEALRQGPGRALEISRE